MLANGIAYRANFVDSMVKKGEYANGYSILIDDAEEAVNAFRKNGGIAILYRDENVDEVIDQLKLAVYDVKIKISDRF